MDNTPKKHPLFRTLVLVWMIIYSPLVSAALGQAKEIKIAAIFSLTGAAASSNAPSVQGVRSAVSKLNEQGGVLGKKN